MCALFITFRQYVLSTAWVMCSVQNKKKTIYIRILVYTVLYTHTLHFFFSNNREFFFISNALPANQFIPTRKKMVSVGQKIRSN